MQVNIKQNGRELGVLEWTQVQQMMAMGTLSPMDLVWDSRANRWVTLDHFSRQMAQYASFNQSTTAQPVTSANNKEGFKWMMIVMGTLCSITAVGALVWYLASDPDAGKKNMSDGEKKGKKDGEIAGKTDSTKEEKREFAGGGKRPEVPPVPKDAFIVYSLDTGNVMDQARNVPAARRFFTRTPFGNKIFDMLQDEELTFPTDMPGVMWFARPPPSLDGTKVTYIAGIYLPLENTTRLQETIEQHEEGGLRGIEFENMGHYRVMRTLHTTLALRMGLDDHAMAVVMLMDEDMNLLSPRFMEESDVGGECASALIPLLENTLPKEPVSTSNPRLLAFLKNTSVGGIHMEIGGWPENFWDKVMERSGNPAEIDTIIKTVIKDLVLGVNLDTAPGSATARVDLHHEKLDGSFAGDGVPLKLLDAIPSDSQLMFSSSLDSKGVRDLLMDELIPLFLQNASVEERQGYEQLRAATKLLTGFEVEELFDVLKGDFVMALGGLENMDEGGAPRVVLGATIGSQPKLEKLMEVLRNGGVIETLAEEGLHFVQRNGCFYLCSGNYRTALERGSMVNAIRGPRRELLANNKIAGIINFQRFGKILDSMGPDAAILKDLREMTLVGDFGKGEQKYQLKVVFNNPRMNLLKTILQQGNATGGGRLAGNGSGFFITEDGYLITNEHVIRGGDSYKIKTSAGEFAARVIKKDSRVDLALMKVEGKFTPIPVASSKDVNLGAKVFTIGYPKASLQGISAKFTEGSVSSLSGMRDDPKHFQISVPIQPGNSGGPLIDEYGNIIGVIVSQLLGERVQNVNYAIKSDKLSTFLADQRHLKKQLKLPYSQTATPKFGDVIANSQPSAALVLVYKNSW